MSKLKEYINTTPRVNPNVNYTLWAMIYQCRSIHCNQCTILVGHVGGEAACVGEQKYMRNICTKEPFCLQGAFLHRCRVSLVPKEGEWRSHNPLFKQGFAPLCPCPDYYLDYCHDYYFKVFTADKHWLFTLFLLLLPFCRANGRLIVNSSSISFISTQEMPSC